MAGSPCAAADPRAADLLALNDALERLATFDAQQNLAAGSQYRVPVAAWDPDQASQASLGGRVSCFLVTACCIQMQNIT